MVRKRRSTSIGLCLPLLVIFSTSATAQQSLDSDVVPITDYEAVRQTKIYEITRAMGAVRLDGVFDEPAWQGVQIEAEFFQTEPGRGVPPVDATEFRLVYDDDYIYIAARMLQSGPIITSSLGRDFTPPGDGDVIAFMFDPFDTDRDGFFFQTNPGGAKRDQQTSGGIRSNEWDGVYDVATRIDDTGWYSEFAVPFKTLRFDESNREQQWGFNVMRLTRYSNEWSMWTPARRPYNIFNVFIAGTILGLEGLDQGRNLKVEPFIVTNYTPDADDTFEPDVGVDVKYGVTSSLTLDLTTNTDFSQVDSDTQQVNLTRFSLFFPEQRDFFLENQGLFDVGASDTGGAGGGGTIGGRGRDVIPFFSRRIGLSESGTPLPIVAGARLTGQIGGFDLGVLNMQVGSLGDTPSDNWSVFRLKRDVLSNSDIGTFLFNRDQGGDTGYWNRSGGADMNLRFLERRLTLSGFAMRTYTPGDDAKNFSGQFQTSYRDDFYSFRSSFMTVEEGFENDFGFIRRDAIRKTNVNAGIRPRPGGGTGLIREINPQVNIDYVTDQTNRLLTRTQRAGITFRFRDADSITLNRNTRFERLDRDFGIRSGIDIPAGDYSLNHWNVSIRTSGGRRVSGNASLTKGDFWTGTQRQTSLGVRFRQSIYFISQVDWSRNKVELAEGSFNTDLVGLHLNFAFSPRVFVENFIQYNTSSNTISSNIRFRFLHHPLSDFFIVYNERRGVNGNDLLDRALIIKLTNLFSF